MFLTFFLTEVKGALRQPMVWIFLLVIALLTFGATVSDDIVIGDTIGNVYKNAPHSVATFTVVLTLLALLAATAFFNNAALRDHQYQFNEILFSTPLSKAGYFFGRFFGALLLSTVPLLGIALGSTLGAIIGPAAGWVDASRIGPVPFKAFLNCYYIFVLPNMFIAGAIIFAMANRWKSTIISFVATLLIIIGYSISGTLLSDIDNETAGALLDIFGIRTYSLEAKYYTPVEKNTLSPTLTGLMFWNRLMWMAVGACILAVSYFSFSFRTKSGGTRLQKKADEPAPPVSAHIPAASRGFGLRTDWLHFASFFRTSFLSMAKSPTFVILFIFCFIIFVIALFNSFEYFGLKSLPVTYDMLDIIEGSSAIFVIIILVFFSGELIWRDRLQHIAEVIDVSPHRSWLSMVAKVLALTSLALVLIVFMAFVGVLYQLMQGFTTIEPGVYLTALFIDMLPGYLIWSAIFIFIQVLVNQRYIGYFVSILVVFFLDFLWSMLDVQSNMLAIGGMPSMQYSDMNGFGDGLTGVFWFTLYWLLFSTLLLAVAGLIWPRGHIGTALNRVSSARRQFKGRYALVTIAVLGTWIACGGFVYYNTQVLNTYKTPDEEKLMQADYEKHYKKYARIPHPKITDVTYHIELYPEDRDVYVTAELRLENKGGHHIDSLHFTTDPEWNAEISIPGAKLVFEDAGGLYRIYKLDASLLPGQSKDIVIKTSYISKGFENELSLNTVAGNGTFLNNWDILPVMGYNAHMELQDKNDRKKYGLPARHRMPPLEQPCGEGCMYNYLSQGRADWVNVETFISTSAGQTAVAPGSLRKQWSEDGRNHYHYKLDHPSQDFYSFMSADYEVARSQWNGIDIEVYHDAKHPYNVQRMVDAVQRSLEYYTKHFGPYYHKQARIIEFPRYSTFAQAFPGTMPYSEGLGFITDLRDEEDNNVVDAVIAHEMAHQWWAHQEISARMQGATMLTESFAEYSSLMVMKATSDRMKMRNFLKYDHDRYLRGRGHEADIELPLYKVENQTHIHYGKGSVILYALQDYIGEDSVNAALRSFLEECRYRDAPYPTSPDFLAHLKSRVPDSLQYLINDWFKEITLYDYRLKEATYQKLGNGKYEITLDVEAYKVKADTMGNETKGTPGDWVDIGLFADEDEKELMLEKRVKFNATHMQFTLLADSLPVKAAIDPRRILIERVYDDNVKTLGEG